MKILTTFQSLLLLWRLWGQTSPRKNVWPQILVESAVPKDKMMGFLHLHPLRHLQTFMWAASPSPAKVLGQRIQNQCCAVARRPRVKSQLGSAACPLHACEGFHAFVHACPCDRLGPVQDDPCLGCIWVGSSSLVILKGSQRVLEMHADPASLQQFWSSGLVPSESRVGSCRTLVIGFPSASTLNFCFSGFPGSWESSTWSWGLNQRELRLWNSWR